MGDQKTIPPETFFKLYLWLVVAVSIMLIVRDWPYSTMGQFGGKAAATLFGVGAFLIPVVAVLRIVYMFGTRFHARAGKYNEK